MKVSVIIPCYNESENIPKIKSELFPVLRALAADGPVELVLVDDGSRDATLKNLTELAAESQDQPFDIIVEVHPQNQGLGAAMRTGFAAASGDVIVTTDSDGTYTFASIPELLSAVTGPVSIVTASPYHPQGGVAGVPGYRLLLSKGSSFLYRLLVDRRVHTYTSLFRAYRREVIDSVPFTANGFLAGTELLVKSMLRGYTVAEYPAILHRRVYGTSKAKIARTILAHLRFQGCVLLYRLGRRSIFKNEPIKREEAWQPSKFPSTGETE